MKIGDQGLVIGARTSEGRRELVGKVVTIVGEAKKGVPWLNLETGQVYLDKVEGGWIIQGNFAFENECRDGKRYPMKGECMLYKRYVMPLNNPDNDLEKEIDKLFEVVE